MSIVIMKKKEAKNLNLQFKDVAILLTQDYQTSGQVKEWVKVEEIEK